MKTRPYELQNDANIIIKNMIATRQADLVKEEELKKKLLDATAENDQREVTKKRKRECEHEETRKKRCAHFTSAFFVAQQDTISGVTETTKSSAPGFDNKG